MTNQMNTPERDDLPEPLRDEFEARAVAFGYGIARAKGHPLWVDGVYLDGDTQSMLSEWETAISAYGRLCRAEPRVSLEMIEAQQKVADRLAELEARHEERMDRLCRAGREDDACHPADHAKAMTLALRRQTSSNLARCYIEMVATKAADVEVATHDSTAAGGDK